MPARSVSDVHADHCARIKKVLNQVKLNRVKLLLLSQVELNNFKFIQIQVKLLTWVKSAKILNPGTCVIH